MTEDRRLDGGRQDRPSASVPTAVHLLTIAPDGDDFVLGRHDLGIYVAIPEPGAVFIQALQRGDSLASATAAASELAGEDVDGADFLAGLSEAGLLDAPAAAGTPAGTAAQGREIRWIEGVRPQAVAWLFGRSAWIGYAAAAVAAAVLLLTRPDLRPTFENFWFLPDPVLSTLALLPIERPAQRPARKLALARRPGGRCAGRVPDQLPRDLPRLRDRPAPDRHRAEGARQSPFLAGMAIDVVVLAAALSTRLAYREGLIDLPGLLDRLLGAVIIIEVLNLVWQCAGVFLRSDAYAVLADALRCHNLYQATWLTVKERLWRLSEAEYAQLAEIGEHDRRVARWFGLVYAAGIVAQVWVLLRLGVPYLVGMGRWVFDNVASLSVTTWAFWGCVGAALLGARPVRRAAPARPAGTQASLGRTTAMSSASMDDTRCGRRPRRDGRRRRRDRCGVAG